MGAAGPGRERDLDTVLGEHQLDSVAAVMHAEAQLFDLWRHCRIESQHLSAGAHTGQAAHDKIHRAGHRPEVNAFRHGAALDVGDVTLQCLLQESPGLVGVVSGQNPCGRDRAER